MTSGDGREGGGVDGLLAPPGPRGTVPPGRRRRRRGPVLATLAALAVLAAVVLVGGGLVLARLVGGAAPPDYPGPGGAPVQVQVAAGQTTSGIAAGLARADVVASAAAFTDAARDEPRIRSVQPGYYQLRARMSARGALALLLDPSSRLRTRVTVPEGSPLARTLDLIAARTQVHRAALDAAVAQPETLGLPSYARGRVEGFLFPATYDVPPGQSAADALRQFTARFGVAADTVQLSGGAAALGLSPYDVVTVASLIEREAARPEDRPKVARVIYNRLARRMPLGLESTIRYALGGISDPRLTRSQIERSKTSPYDTLVHVGLPPGPIANPGEAALSAALHPAAASWLYFVTLPKDNRTAFVDTYAEFQRLESQCQAQGGC